MSDMEKVIEKALLAASVDDQGVPDIDDQVRLVAQALTASGYGGFEVVPLEWQGVGHMHSGDNEGWEEWAETPFGSYYIDLLGMHFIVSSDFNFSRIGFETTEAAKAACEADHRERVSKLVRGVDQRKLSEDDVEWVVNDIAELGVKIGDQFFFLYKGRSLVYDPENGHEEDDPRVGYEEGDRMKWRYVFKREFGECCHPINHADYSKIGTVSLSVGEWHDLPPLPAAPEVK